ncbi:WLM domain-containing protein [Dichotomopilus funicola]|uniref:WLM domain-containing protein n=1 Tax=Dichotomopilus funicola TaxID=1934379 RepID=A0AAN6V669_9PEZI|nr:WLM domain-containing protein [Dichotomopilus funicola]
MQREIDPLIGYYSHFKTAEYPRQDEALHLLKRIASMVKPIMRAHGWRVGKLSEMYPSQANLLGLNVNRGEEILLRLREPYDRSQFLPFERVVDTMLHELCHNVHGPHDDKFNALWNGLREELEGLMMKGFTGDNFLGSGQRLGGGYLPPQEARRLARAEAERRRAANMASRGGGGIRLGGAPAPVRRGDKRDAILDSIARRNRVSNADCANNNRSDEEIRQASQSWTRNGFRTRAEEDAANEAAIAQALWELVQEDRKKLQDWETQSFHPPPPIPFNTRPPPGPPRPRSPELKSYWSCNICTLRNPTTVNACNACETPRPPRTFPGHNNRDIVDLTESPPKKRPKPSNSNSLNRRSTAPVSVAAAVATPPIPPRPSTWTCSFCSKEMESQWWTCSLCGTMKSSS